MGILRNRFKISSKMLLICLSLPMILGFRTYFHVRMWHVSPTPSAFSKVFVTYTDATQTLENDLPSDDALAGPTPVTVQQAMQSIMDDYNNIQGSFVQLAEITDPDYNEAYNGDRVIRISKAATDGLTGGQAAYKFDSAGKMIGCEIRLNESAFKKAKGFIAVTTHEIGHCMGLDHSQETIHSIMTYFADNDVIYRLQPDDKMGIIYLYPTDPDKAKEAATYGLSCSKR